jgi:hypothetical protein
LPKREQEKVKGDYFKDRQKMLDEVHGESEVRDAIRKNLIIDGKFAQAKVEDKLKEIP